MADEPCIATRPIDIAACGGPRRRKERKGLEGRTARVDLAPPDRKPRGTPPLSMMAVHITEPGPPADPLDWMLLTTEGDVTAALDTISFHERRWLIEEYFKALKVGTRIEDRPGRRPEEVSGLRRHHRMPRHDCRASRTPASYIVHRDEITVLNIHKPVRRHQPRGPPDPEPTIKVFAIEVARVAGFIPGKRQPLPGTEKLWQGYKILLNFNEYHRAMRKLDMQKSMNSMVSD